jgi:hypothetical protein
VSVPASIVSASPACEEDTDRSMHVVFGQRRGCAQLRPNVAISIDGQDYRSGDTWSIIIRGLSDGTA